MSTDSNASAAALGYLYQCRMALLSAIRVYKTSPSVEVSIERFDDIAIEEAEKLIESIQTKHHGSAGDLTDSSVDLWKTIGIWSGRVAQNPVTPLETHFTIITTGTAPADSAAALLRLHRTEKDALNALTKLESAAKKSTNLATNK